jgi:sugar/nucleoside kinase (ribokinase family)
VIVCTGTIGVDITNTPSTKGYKTLGGSGVYFAISASHFGPTGLISIMGTDLTPPQEHLLKTRLNCEGVEQADGLTFHYVSEFDETLTIRTPLKTELNTYGDWTPKVPDSYKNNKLNYIGNVHPTHQLSILEQLDHPEFTVIDTIKLWMDIAMPELLEVISKVKGIIVNDIEIRRLANEPNLIKAAHKVLDMGPDFVVVKRGEHGATLFRDSLIFPTNAYPVVDVVDPTGAGDAFGGGFIGHLSRVDQITDQTMKEAVLYGNIMGSFAIEGYGIERLETLTLEKIEERFQAYIGLTSI